MGHEEYEDEEEEEGDGEEEEESVKDVDSGRLEKKSISGEHMRRHASNSCTIGFVWRLEKMMWSCA